MDIFVEASLSPFIPGDPRLAPAAAGRRYTTGLAWGPPMMLLAVTHGARRRVPPLRWPSIAPRRKRPPPCPSACLAPPRPHTG